MAEMLKQEYKIVRKYKDITKEDFVTFHYTHDLKSAYRWAMENYIEAIQDDEYSEVLLYGLNNSPFCGKWKLLKTHKEWNELVDDFDIDEEDVNMIEILGVVKEVK